MQMIRQKDEFIEKMVNERESKSHECYENLHKQQEMIAAKNEV